MTVQVPAPALVSDEARLRSSLAHVPTSPAEAVWCLDRAEGVYETVLRNGDGFAAARCEQLILRWAHTHRPLLPYARYLAVIARVEAREPRGWGRRMFDLGSLASGAEFIGEVEAAVPDRFARLPEFQPLSEIVLRGERFLVHIGNRAYAGALVIISDLRIVRLLGFETPQHGPIVRVSDGDDGVVLAPRGVVTVECVIFNRPDLLPCL